MLPRKRRQSSMEGALSKIIFFYQAVALQCFSVNAESLKPTSASGISRTYKLFVSINFIILMVNVAGIIFAVYSNLQQGGPSGVRTGVFVQSATYFLIVLVILVTAINNFLLRLKANDIFKNCFRISEILSLLNQNVDYSSLTNDFKHMMVILFLNYVLSNVALLTSIYKSNQRVFLTIILSVYPFFCLTALVSYWSFLIRLTGEHLRLIKNCLVHLHKKHELFSSCPEPYNYDLRTRRIQETFNYCIVKLKSMYATIYDSTSLVNEFIEIPICVFLIYVVLAIISAGYKLFLSFQGDASIELIAIPLYVIYTCSILLVTLIFSCSSTYNVVDDTLSQVHTFEFKRCERDAGVSSILLEFACQIGQRPIEFKVGGFYCLSQSLLATIITGSLTYIMLLIQFYKPATK